MGCLKLNNKHYLPDSYHDGMQIQERSYSATTKGYRFGFNGYENEPDIAGEGSVIDFGMRIYDSRLGRFFSMDPIIFPYWSPYQYDANSPILVKDVDGMGPPRKYGLFTRLDNFMKGDKFKNKANKYARKHNIDEDKIVRRRHNIEMPGGGGNTRVVFKDKNLKDYSEDPRPEDYPIVYNGGKIITEFHPAVPIYNIGSNAGLWGDGRNFWNQDQTNGDYVYNGIALIPGGGIYARTGKVVLKGVTKTIPYIGKSINFAKRYSKEFAKTTKLKPMLEKVDSKEVI